MPDNTLPETPDVDVIICTHNRPELLREALAAVLGQDYPGRITCTLVFDRTEPDRTLEQDDELRRVHVIPNTRTGGLAGARNSGIEHGDAPLVSFCDDDDYWMPSKVSRQVSALRRSGERTCVAGITILYDDREITRLPIASEMTFENLVRNRVMPAHPSSVMVRRDSLLNDIGMVDEEIPGSYAEDYDWILRAAQAGPITVVSEPLVRVRWGQSLFASRWSTIIQALDYLVEKFPQFHADRRALARIRGQQAFGYAALGERRRSLATSWQAIRLSPGEKRAYVAVPVALGLISAQRVMTIANRSGRGI